MFSHLTTEGLLQKLEESGDRAPIELIQAILSKGKEVVQPLSRVLQDRRYWEAGDDKLWMPIHAVKLLGTLADPQALPQLVDALLLAEETEDEWVMEDLPIVFGRIGPPAVRPLMEFILARKGDNELWWPRSAAANGLIAIAVRHPQERERVLSFLHELFSEDEDPEFLGFVVCDFLDLHDPSSFPVIEDAFNRGLIEERIVSRGNFLQEREEPPDEEALAQYNIGLLEFYNPQAIAKRQERWEEQRREKEQLIAQRREKREKSIAIELKRLEIVMELIERKVLPLTSKVGRNEPCPCGSGKKFKKCHLPLMEFIPPKQVLGGGNYAASDNLQRAAPYNPLLVLENLTALAFEAERDGDVTRAFEIFRMLEPLAERSGMLGDLLHNWEVICYNHPVLGEEGLAIMRRLQSFYQDKDREKWAYASMDLADYLNLLGRWEEGRTEYEKLQRTMPDFLYIHIRFARFLGKGGHVDEAVQHYKQVLQMENQAKRDDLEMAAEELKKLASRHKVELDPLTRETIKRLSFNYDKENVPDMP